MKTIKAMREDLGMTQVKFSEKMNIPRRTIESWEGGVREPASYMPEMLRVYVEHLKRTDYEVQEAKKIRLKRMFGERGFVTDSDRGGIRVFNESFSVVVPNGKGNGTTYCAMFGQKEFNSELMEFSGITLEGKMSISDHDCEKRSRFDLNGSYSVYYSCGFIAFVKVDN